MADGSETSQPGTAVQPNVVSRVVLFFVVVSLVAVAVWQFGDQLSLSQLAAKEAWFRQFQTDHPVLIYLIAFAIYVTVAGLSLPGAAAMTLVVAWLFGFWPGLILVSFGSTTGATVAFLLSRYLLQASVTRRFGPRLAAFNAALQREGTFYLLSLRLIPAVPFFVINAVMGLTPIRVRTFFWISQIGMLPGTAVYVYAGASVPNLQTLADKGIAAIFTPSQLSQLTAAFVLLAVFPLLTRKLLKHLQIRLAKRVSG